MLEYKREISVLVGSSYVEIFCCVVGRGMKEWGNGEEFYGIKV